MEYLDLVWSWGSGEVRINQGHSERSKERRGAGRQTVHGGSLQVCQESAGTAQQVQEERLFHSFISMFSHALTHSALLWAVEISMNETSNLPSWSLHF